MMPSRESSSASPIFSTASLRSRSNATTAELNTVSFSLARNSLKVSYGSESVIRMLVLGHNDHAMWVVTSGECGTNPLPLLAVFASDGCTCLVSLDQAFLDMRGDGPADTLLVAVQRHLHGLPAQTLQLDTHGSLAASPSQALQPAAAAPQGRSARAHAAPP